MTWLSTLISDATAAGEAPATIIKQVGGLVTGLKTGLNADLTTLLKDGGSVAARQAMVTKIVTMDNPPPELLGAIEGLDDPSLTEPQLLTQVQQIDQALAAGV